MMLFIICLWVFCLFRNEVNVLAIYVDTIFGSLLWFVFFVFNWILTWVSSFDTYTFITTEFTPVNLMNCLPKGGCWSSNFVFFHILDMIWKEETPLKFTKYFEDDKMASSLVYFRVFFTLDEIFPKNCIP